jgi:hypothetical protein
MAVQILKVTNIASMLKINLIMGFCLKKEASKAKAFS